MGIIKDHERSMWASLIHGNIISDMKTLITMAEDLNIEVSDDINELFQEILELPDPAGTIGEELRKKLVILWNSDVIKHAFDNRVQALDSAE